MLALFRLIDLTCGRVLLDGVDAAKIGLDALRSQLAIIPQVFYLLWHLEAFLHPSALYAGTCHGLSAAFEDLAYARAMPRS